MEDMIIIGIVVAASLVAGIFMYRSMKASGGCGCGCHVGKGQEGHHHDGECCKNSK